MAAKRMNFFPGSVQGLHFDGVTPVVTLTVLAHNTSNQRMTIKSLSGNLYTNGTYVGNVSTFTSQVIEPNSQTAVSVDVRLGLFNIVNDLIRAIQYGNFAQAVRFTGAANVDNLQIPIDLNYQFG